MVKPRLRGMDLEAHEFGFQVEVDASPSEVFAVITDLSMAGVLSPSIIKTEPLTDQPFGVGFRWRETRKMFLILRPKAEIEVTHYVPDGDALMYAVLIDDGCNHVTGEFHLKACDAGTHVTYRGVAQVYKKNKATKEKELQPSPSMARMVQKFDAKCLPRLAAHFRGEL